MSVTAEIESLADVGQVIEPNAPGDPLYTINGLGFDPDDSGNLDVDNYLIALKAGDQLDVDVDHYQDVVINIDPPGFDPEVDDHLLAEISHGVTYSLTAPVSGVYTFVVAVRMPAEDPAYSLHVKVGATDLAARSLAWDRNGGVQYGYEVVGAALSNDATIRFYWVDGSTRLGELTELRSDLQAGATNSKVGRYVVGKPNITTFPPEGATGLRMVLDEEKSVVERSESNNSFTREFDPTIEIAATYGSTAADPGKIGRFFSHEPSADEPGIDVVVTGEIARFTLPDELAALKPTSVVVKLGSKTLSTTKGGDGLSYTTEDFDPSVLKDDTDLTVEVKRGGTLLRKERAGVDVEPLPAWFLKAPGEKKVKFDKVKKTYELTSTFFDVKTGKLGDFALPGGVGSGDIWLGAKATSGLDAKAAVVVEAGLDRTKSPSILASVDVDLTFLGTSVYTKHLVSNGRETEGPFVIKMDLNPGTLAFGTATLTYAEAGGEKVDVFGGLPFTKGVFTATSAVMADLAHDLKVSLTVDGDGGVTDGNLEFHLAGVLSGSLVKMEILSNSTAKMILSQLLKLLKVSPGGIIESILSAAAESLRILPKFEMRSPVTGLITLDGKAGFKTDRGVEVKSFGGTFDMQLTAGLFITFLGKSEEIAGLPDQLNQALKIKKKFSR